MNKKRVKVVVNYIIGPLLFLFLSYAIYNQIKHQDNLENSWKTIVASLTGADAWKLYTVILLSVVNWGIESRKWQILVKPIQEISFIKAFKAILTGLSLSLFIPNRLGEYLGRMLFMNEGNKLRSIALTVVGSISQIIVTLVCGLTGFVLLRELLMESFIGKLSGKTIWMNTVILIILIVSVLLLVLYFKLNKVVQWFGSWKIIQRLTFFVEHIKDFNASTLTTILRLSFLRYLVFIVQYVLLFQLFGVIIPLPEMALMVTVLFLVLIIVPTLPIADVGVRGEIGIQLFGLLSANNVGILAAAAGIWLINLIVPSIAGAVFILSVKLFDR